MRIQISNLKVLLRTPATSYGNVFLGPFVFMRKLSSDIVNVAESPSLQEVQLLTDLHGRKHDYLRISLTERCNLRCQYCMPLAGVPLSPRPSLLSREELSRVVAVFAALGVRKLRLTGGEPTLRKDLADIIQELSSIPGIESVSMTSNGLVLLRRLPALQRAGLAAINISIDSLKPDRYEQMARRPGLERVLAGIDLALQLGYSPVKINVVLMKGFNDDEICDFVEYTKDRDVEVRFIEFMPFSGNEWSGGKLVPHVEAVRVLLQSHPEAQPVLPRPNDTARVWKVPGYTGSVGFISSMTKNFCSTCNRLRLTADGNLKVCLFGASEVSLRDSIRSGATDDQLELLIRTALRNKKPQHAAAELDNTGALRRGYYASEPAQNHLQLPRKLQPNSTPESKNSTDTGLFQPNTTPKSKNPFNNVCDVPTTRSLQMSTIKHCSTEDEDITCIKAELHSASRHKKYTSGMVSNLLSARSQQMSMIRRYSTEDSSALTHLDKRGKPRMVDVGNKDVTQRKAAARCELRVGSRLLRLLKDARLPKGDALTVAQIAGVTAAKKTSDLIPMCHQLPLDYVRVDVNLPKGDCASGGDISVYCEVSVTAKTGAEMEAMTGAAVAALTLYDMCKAVDKDMRVMNLRVVSKSGGRSGTWPPEEPDIRLREHDTSKIETSETYAPTTIMHF